MNPQASPWFFIGVGSTSLLMGFLTGASSTPVVGAVITGVLGGAVTIWAARSAAQIKQPEPAEQIIVPDLYNQKALFRLLGQGLTLFAICFLVGSLSGAITRIAWLQYFGKPRTAGLTIPWDSSKAKLPANPEEAWKWVSFSKDAAAIGVPASEIRAVYERYSACVPPGCPDPLPKGSRPIAAQKFTPEQTDPTEAPSWPSHRRASVEKSTNPNDFPPIFYRKIDTAVAAAAEKLFSGIRINLEDPDSTIKDSTRAPLNKLEFPSKDSTKVHTITVPLKRAEQPPKKQ